MKKFLLLIFTVVISLSARSQTIEVNSYSRNSAAVSDTIEIYGSNFGLTPSNIKVSFGAVAGQIVSVKSSVIKVRVPAGATNGSIIVTQLSTGKQAFGKDFFLLSFGGTNFTAASFSSDVSFASDPGTYDIIPADFDNDGLVDYAAISLTSNLLSIFTNNTTANTISFINPRKTKNLGAPVISGSAGDLNGDGLMDLVLARYTNTFGKGDRVLVLQNTSTTGNISFADPEEYFIDGNNAQNVRLFDLDNDGKTEVIVSNQSNNIVSIFKNTSTLLDVSLNPTFISVAFDGMVSTSGLAIADLNGDKLPELITTPFLGNSVFIKNNTSQAANISFGTLSIAKIPGNIINVIAADFDNDSKLDLAVTKYLTNNISVVKNITTTLGGAILFSTAVDVATQTKPWGISTGDVDGDGLTDIAVGGLSENRITVLKNSTVSSLSFTRFDVVTTEFARNVRIADVTNDGKPDLAVNGTNSSKLTILKNLTCIRPSLKNVGSLSLCSPQSVKFLATNGKNITYKWFKDNIEIPGAFSSYYSTSTAGSYYVTATEGTCSESSTPMNVTVQVGGTIPTIPNGTVVGTPCLGKTLNLSSDNTPGLTYEWTGSNNFTSTSGSPVINNVQYINAGNYIVKAKSGVCTGDPDTVFVGINPSIVKQTISTTTSQPFCTGNPLTLSVPEISGATYQWKNNGGNIASANTRTLNVAANGSYSVTVENSFLCGFETDPFAVSIVTKPVAAFTSGIKTCVGEKFSIVNSSTIDNQFSPQYLWNFGDNTSSTDFTPLKNYTTSGPFTISLKVSYSSDCFSEATKNITSFDVPSLSITKPLQQILCSEDSIKLQASSGFASYLWSNGKTTSDLAVKFPEYYVVSATSADGCIKKDSIEIVQFQKPAVDILNEFARINKGDSIELKASGAATYTWTPTLGLSDPASETPYARPEESRFYKVIGKSAEGCLASDTITVTVVPFFNTTPTIVFSPNGDGKDDYWTIKNVEFFPNTEVTVLNRQGTEVFSTANYSNNGGENTFSGLADSGKDLPEGVYYYILKFEKITKTGTVTILR